MDHPNIAKVLDAGTTDSGRPFFVMELVRGVPITEYCDQHQLTPRQRLELFVPVCHAVQHAHQKGVIHRDLKPSNVLVAEYDEEPVAKIIDFGVVKAIGQRLTEKTMFTQVGQLVGTVDYMSPEQAKLNQLDVDTRTDIYSLGVLLYELLTGETPFERKRLHAAALDEMLRIVREEEPPRPSTRLSSSGTLPSIAAQRTRTETADDAGAWRVGLDRHEGAGQGPLSPLPDGQRAGDGRPAVSGRRAGVGRVHRARCIGRRSSCGGIDSGSQPPRRWSCCSSPSV